MSLAHPRPLTSALIGSLFAGGALLAADWYNSPHLVVTGISAVEVPTLDGDISDEAWKEAAPVEVLTRHGGDFGGSGESRIEVRAVHDDHNLYLALQWDDPTRSLEYMPLIKDGGVWRSVQTNAAEASEPRFFDDRIAIMLAPSGLALIGSAIHLGAKPLPDAPAGQTGRGLHYTAAGKMVDMWIWHAALGTVTDRVQDDYLGPPLPYKAGSASGGARYLGGIGEDDPDHPVGTMNCRPDPEAVDGAVIPLRLPRVTAEAAESDAIRPDAEYSDPPENDRLWAMAASASQPYSPAADKAIPEGAVIPGVVVDDTTVPGPYDVVGRGSWAGGHWVLELRRSLEGSTKDIAIKDGIMMWFAVFDHAQSRHTYHLRPLILEIK